MQAKRIIGLLGYEPGDYSDVDFHIEGLSIDSRTVADGYCFIAMRGTHFDGHDFIEEAVNRGARLVIYEKGRIDISKGRYREAAEKAVFLGADDTRRIIGRLAREFFNNPARKLNITGITGTNGKTTVSLLVKHIFEHNGIKTGLIGTINYKIAGRTFPAKNTTPEALTLYSLFAGMVEYNLSHCVMEVSSHALDQYRVEGIEFKNAVFTNMTHDHLDYHHSKEDYFLAKARLFKNLGEGSCAVINSDDPYGQRLKELTKARITEYAVENKNAPVRAENIILSLDATQFDLISPWGRSLVRTSLVGVHNVYNILAAVCIALQEGLSQPSIVAAIQTMHSVPGRLERIPGRCPFEIFIDYAHTDDALKHVLSALRQLRPRKIITVFGCGGDRDRKKRPLMGKVSSEMSDFIILTNDNPRSEPPDDIIHDIKAGFDSAFADYKVVLDRAQAIREAINRAQSKDFILIAGKGHETSQIFREKTIDFDDREVVKEILENKNSNC